MDRKQMTCYLRTGRLVRPLQLPQGRGAGLRATGLTPVRRHYSGKGNRALLPHPKRSIPPPLAPRAACAHMASWDTP
jgi:hypothetical protein